MTAAHNGHELRVRMSRFRQRGRCWMAMVDGIIVYQDGECDCRACDKRAEKGKPRCIVPVDHFYTMDAAKSFAAQTARG